MGGMGQSRCPHAHRAHDCTAPHTPGCRVAGGEGQASRIPRNCSVSCGRLTQGSFLGDVSHTQIAAGIVCSLFLPHNIGFPGSGTHSHSLYSIYICMYTFLETCIPSIFTQQLLQAWHLPKALGQIWSQQSSAIGHTQPLHLLLVTELHGPGQGQLFTYQVCWLRLCHFHKMPRKATASTVRQQGEGDTGAQLAFSFLTQSETPALGRAGLPSNLSPSQTPRANRDPGKSTMILTVTLAFTALLLMEESPLARDPKQVPSGSS